MVEPLELHRLAAVDRLADVEPAEVEVAVERVERESRRVRVEDADPRPGRSRAGTAGPSSSPSRPSTRAGAPPMSPSLRATSEVIGRPASEVSADHDGIETRAEVVDVRDRDVLDAALAQRGERPGRCGSTRRGRRGPARRATAGPSSRKSSPVPVSRSETRCENQSGSGTPSAATCARVSSAVWKLVISATGISTPRSVAEPRSLAELPGRGSCARRAPRRRPSRHRRSASPSRRRARPGRRGPRRAPRVPRRGHPPRVRAGLGQRRHDVLRPGRARHAARRRSTPRRARRDATRARSSSKRPGVEPEPLEQLAGLAIDLVEDHRAAAISRGSVSA